MKKLTSILFVLAILGVAKNSNAQFTVDFDNTFAPVYVSNYNDYWTPAPDCFLYNLPAVTSYIPSIDAVGNTNYNWTDLVLPRLTIANDSIHVELEVVVPEAGSYWYYVGRSNASHKEVAMYAPVGTMSNAQSSYTLIAPNAGTYTISFWVQNTQYSGSYTTAVANSADIGTVRIFLRQGKSGYATMGFKKITISNGVYNPTGLPCVVNSANTCTDTDNDGVCDNVDDYPNDANKAFSSTMPWMNWMYEDLFPSYGDFDFNDMVVSAEREVITDADNDVRFVKIKAVVKAAGAAIHQGWAVELTGINPSDVASVSGSNMSGGVMTLAGNGTESGQTHAVIPMFDNFGEIIHRGGGAFFNTVAGSAAGTCDTVDVLLELKKSSSIQISDLHYNFFSFRTEDRSHEIHEIGFAPTDLADMTLFGTKKDASDLNIGESYISVDGLPWAVSSSGADYTTEKTDILEAFLKMAAWAQSGGSLYQDWHTNTSEGTYRNNSKIY